MINDLLLKIKNRRLVMMLVPVITGTFVGGVLVVKPAFQKICAVHAKKQSIVKNEAVFKNVVAWEKKMAVYKGRLSQVGEKTQMIERLNTLASESGLLVLSVAPEEKRALGTYFECAPVKIEAEGNYHQLGDFVSRVENLPEFVKILNVDIRRESSSEETMSNSPATGLKASAAADGIRARNGGQRLYKISVGVGFFYAQKDAL